MATREKSYFEILNAIDLSDKIRTKNGLSYLSWSDAWAVVKKVHPEANFKIFEQQLDEYGNTRFWFDDGKTGWVKVSVTIGDNTVTEVLAIMDFKNKSIPAENITSVDANKAIKRCLVKACALHGIGLYIYSGEDLPDEVANIEKLKKECMDLIQKKCKLSEGAKEKVSTICKSFDDSGDPRLIEDIDKLTELKKKLMTVRK